MLVRFLFLSLLMVDIGGCATSAELAPTNSSSAIVDDAQMGRIDVCREPRWAEWRFDGGVEGVARLTALQAQAKRRRDSMETVPDADQDLWLLQRARLDGLQNIIRATRDASDEAQWHAAFDEQEKLAHARYVEVAAIKGSSFAPAIARQSVWDRASRDQSPSRLLESRIARCLNATGEAQAVFDIDQLLIAALDRNHWPSDAIDGTGATRKILNFRSSDLGHACLKRNIMRLDAAAARRKIPRGGWAYLRVGLELEASPKLFAIHAVASIKQVRRFFASLPPPRSTAEDLWRRVRVDQFALEAQRLVRHSYPDSKARARGNVLIDEAFADIVKENASHVKELLRSRDWFNDAIDGEGASRDGWVLVQHSDQDLALQRDVLRRMEPLLASGRVARLHYAMLWDRVAVGDKRLQRYGTQMECKIGKRGPQIGLEDPGHVDARRKEMGMGPWDGYVASFGTCD